MGVLASYAAGYVTQFGENSHNVAVCVTISFECIHTQLQDMDLKSTGNSYLRVLCQIQVLLDFSLPIRFVKRPINMYNYHAPSLTYVFQTQLPSSTCFKGYILTNFVKEMRSYVTKKCHVSTLFTCLTSQTVRLPCTLHFVQEVLQSPMCTKLLLSTKYESACKNLTINLYLPMNLLSVFMSPIEYYIIIKKIRLFFSHN